MMAPSGLLGSDPAEMRAQRLGIGRRVALAGKLRALIHAMAATSADDATLDRAAELIEKARALLASQSSERGSRLLDGPLMGLGKLSELGPFTTPNHALAPSLDLNLAETEAEAVAVYGAAHEGGPGLLHGGFIAATFDELLGVVQRGAIRMTGELTIRYRAPAYLNRPLRYRTWLDRIEGRKAFVSGTLHDGGTLCAEASATFIALREAPFAVPD
ncbi:PaaI family thioesterase [Novosphingobium sp. fls2-241-R2A-195]|jgi:acyl-coenzyme A thioesterase PaaI-like protein|uniref:PaaI family thioesterase n=1 Tax=Novosphingobium sp. fls2-241-R2A-195 TaxID=3040296 RepID=UPI002549EEE3|nr:PaaI family thioesterase [Novosphingobium sp. fls2-241-R2A-195]